MKFDNKILASHWTVAGNRYCGDGIEVAEHDLKKRIEVCAAVGFQGMGFVELDLLHTKETYGYAEAKRMAHGSGITEIEVEVLDNWWDKDDQAAMLTRKNVFEAAEQLGARHIKVFSGCGVNQELFLTEFAKLCKDAENIGTRIALEMMPFDTDTDTIEKVVRVLRAVSAPNAGMCLDTWHVCRCGAIDQVSMLRPEEITTVELDDGAQEPVGSLWEDTVDYRLPAGEGDFPCGKILGELLERGYAGTIGCEIISKEFRALPLRRAASRAYASVRQYL